MENDLKKERELYTLKKNQSLKAGGYKKIHLLSEKTPFKKVYELELDVFPLLYFKKHTSMDFQYVEASKLSICEVGDQKSLCFELEKMLYTRRYPGRFFYPNELTTRLTDFQIKQEMINSYQAILYDYENVIYRVGKGVFESYLKGELIRFKNGLPHIFSKHLINLSY